MKALVFFTVMAHALFLSAGVVLGQEKPVAQPGKQVNCPELGGTWKVQSCTGEAPPASLLIVQSGCREVAIFGVDPKSGRTTGLSLLTYPGGQSETKASIEDQDDGIKRSWTVHAESAWDLDQKGLKATYNGSFVFTTRDGSSFNGSAKGTLKLRLDGETLKSEIAATEGSGQPLAWVCDYKR